MNTPNLSSVPALITHPSALARALKVSLSAVSQWKKINRLPAKRIIEIANFYDVEVGDLILLTGSEENRPNTTKLKTRDVLPALSEHQEGKITLEEAATKGNITVRAARLILVHWGTSLPTLHNTLEALDQGQIDLEEAKTRLKVGRSTIFGLRKKYGYAPGYPERKKPQARSWAERQAPMRPWALQVLEGKITLIEGAARAGVALRTLTRYMRSMTPKDLNELAHWPPAFRQAYVMELEGATEYVEHWLNYAETHEIPLEKYVKYPKTPEKWEKVPVMRCLAGVLLGEATLDEVSESRGTASVHLSTLFNSECTRFGITFNGIQRAGMHHQTALAELILAERKQSKVGQRLFLATKEIW